MMLEKASEDDAACLGSGIHAEAEVPLLLEEAKRRQPVHDYGVCPLSESGDMDMHPDGIGWGSSRHSILPYQPPISCDPSLTNHARCRYPAVSCIELNLVEHARKGDCELARFASAAIIY